MCDGEKQYMLEIAEPIRKKYLNESYTTIKWSQLILSNDLKSLKLKMDKDMRIRDWDTLKVIAKNKKQLVI